MSANQDILRGRGVAVVIVAAGSGSRMGSAVPKQFLPLVGVPVLVRTVRRMRELLPEAKLVVVLSPDRMPDWATLCVEWDLQGTHTVCAGGATRFESVRNALAATTGSELIAVHDGVRPLFSPELVRRTLRTALDTGTAIPAVEPADSFRIVDAGGSQVVDRTRLRAIQTPQVFRAELLRRAYEMPCHETFTDDASVVERLGIAVTLCQGERTNLKITTPEDLLASAAWLGK